MNNKQTNLRRILIVALVTILVALTFTVVRGSAITDTDTVPAPVGVSKTEQDKALKVFISRSIEITRTKISPARKHMMEKILFQVANEHFNSPEVKEAWVSLIAVESRYDGRAKSKTGALGLGQIIPSYRNDFAQFCGIGETTKEDLSDDYTNATLSACQFSHLVEKFGNIRLAFVSYNQGEYSDDVKKAIKGQAMSDEPSQYLVAIQNQLTKAK